MPPLPSTPSSYRAPPAPAVRRSPEPDEIADVAAQLAALVDMAALCGQALEAASVSAADPQLRAMLLHRAALQHHASADLSNRMRLMLELSARTAPASHGTSRPTQPPAAVRDRAGDTPIQLAARRASRAATTCGTILRSELGDSSIRPLLMRYYHEVAELLRVLEQLVRDQQPANRRIGNRQYGSTGHAARGG
ncbi:hypothetical protein [Cupriavidus sp. AU9028]|uniref:hypothetical protein n=1 Tax=Cupriavidus sp. AU9028 TaxID=2871157 RepID=UPI001C97330D|nr:hypothetical protein [Cupriavidus sp. AU9028]MBY4896073.1 hypothetical protein [Cupriavidus sp. AU9028]